MIYIFNGNELYVYVYMICRFGYCLLIDFNINYSEIEFKLGD